MVPADSAAGPARPEPTASALEVDHRPALATRRLPARVPRSPRGILLRTPERDIVVRELGLGPARTLAFWTSTAA